MSDAEDQYPSLDSEWTLQAGPDDGTQPDDDGTQPEDDGTQPPQEDNSMNILEMMRARTESFPEPSQTSSASFLTKKKETFPGPSLLEKKKNSTFPGPIPSPHDMPSPMLLTGRKKRKTTKDPGFYMSPKRRVTKVPMYKWLNQSDDRQILVFLYRLGNGRPAVWRIRRRHELRIEQLAYLVTHSEKPKYRHLGDCDGSGSHFCCAWKNLCDDLTHVNERTMMQCVSLPSEGYETRFITLNS